jgi:predicted Ser/Thr protein kinase
MPADLETLLPPRYRDVRLIAHGGMGDIYRATDQELGRDVAVKVLSDRFAADESSRARFKREALAAARLSGTPNIVTIFDVGEHQGRPLIVMEYLPGGSLEQRLSGGKSCAPQQALDWLEEAAVALDAAHAAGIVHRDVKPGNLLLDGHGHLQVADFGIASAVGLDSFTQAGTILGTAGYLSPEQAKGERATAASDLYGLAVVAWELLTGHRPFESSSPTAEATAHANAPVPSVHAVNRSLPRAYDAIFVRALAKDPAARYPTAAELVGALRRGLHDDAGDTWIVPAPLGTAVTRIARAPARRSWIPLLVILLLAGVALAVALTSNGGSQHAAGPRTVVRTVTGPSQTVRQTVTAQTATAPAGASGAELNNAGYSKLQNRDYAGALPLLEQAVQQLNGAGSLDEAYADYNLAYATLASGQCADVSALLDRSQQIQGHRREIDRLRHDAEKSCGRR